MVASLRQQCVYLNQTNTLYISLLINSVRKLFVSLQHPEIRSNLEASDEVLERTAGTDINNVYVLTNSTQL